MGLREQVGAAVNARDLSSSHEYEKAIDRITALGFARRLGTLLWRLKYGNDRLAYKPASLLLARELPRRLQLSTKVKVAEQAINEWLFEQCRRCFGSGHVMDGQLLKLCPYCNGAGTHRYNDEDRYARIAKRDYQKLSKHLGQAANILSKFDRHVAAVLKIQLERG